jgi:lysophospholipase L1-like esterase
VKKAGFILAPLLLLLGVGELVCRIAWSPPGVQDLETEGAVMAPHPRRLWGLKPGAMVNFGATAQIDDHGLRTAPVQNRSLRILTLGDSSLFGHGLNDADTPHVLLAQALEARGVEADVYCGAVPGYSTEQSLLLLAEHGNRIDPDLLILGSLWSDSMRDTVSDAEWIAELSRATTRVDTLFSHSQLWLWLRFALHPPEASRLGFHPVTWLAPPPDSTWSSRNRPQVQEGLEGADTPRVDVDAYQRNLEALLGWAQARNRGALLLQGANVERMQGITTRVSAYTHRQEQVARRADIPLVDSAQVYRQAGLSPEEALLDGLHPSAAGNRAVAQAMADRLLEAGWPEVTLTPKP